MDAYGEIERRVEERLFEENSKIFRLALITTKRICTKCNFRCSFFAYRLLVRRKTELKRKIHHFFNSTHRRTFKWEVSDGVGGVDMSITSITDAENRLDQINDSLNSIRPCDDCIRKYNPSNRRVHTQEKIKQYWFESTNKTDVVHDLSNILDLV